MILLLTWILFPPGGPFNLFGFVQNGSGLVVQPNHQIGPNLLPAGVDGQNNLVNDVAAAGNQGAQLDNVQNIPNFNLNDDVVDSQELDLNVQPNLQEMIMDPMLIGSQHHEMHFDINEFLNQVNVEEEDNQVEQEVPAVDQSVIEPALVPPAVEVNIHVVNECKNFLPLEIWEDDLMGDKEFQQQLDEEAAQGNVFGPQNIHVVFVFTNFQPNLSTASSFVSAAQPIFEDSSGMWKKFFAPQPGVAQFFTPIEWASFFTALLMSPSHFVNAKEFIQSTNLLHNIGEGQNVGFSLPINCPSKIPLTCKLSPMTEVEDVEIDAKDAPPVDSDESVAPATGLDPTTKAVTKKNRKTTTALVETQVRMSPRVKKNKQGLKDPVYKDKSYLGCNSTPPPISTKTIRKLSASL